MSISGPGPVSLTREHIGKEVNKNRVTEKKLFTLQSNRLNQPMKEKIILVNTVDIV